jgi:hypothetical protein
MPGFAAAAGAETRADDDRTVVRDRGAVAEPGKGRFLPGGGYLSETYLAVVQKAELEARICGD